MKQQRIHHGGVLEALGSRSAQFTRHHDGTIGHNESVRLTTISPLANPADLQRDFVFHLVSVVFEVPVGRLNSSSRSIQAVCLARQVCMYLLHTVFSMSYHEIGALLGRDRTTISHGCSLVEDLRDEPAFDQKVSIVEAVAEKAAAIVCSCDDLKRRGNVD